jgi:hypothetical protein
MKKPKKHQDTPWNIVSPADSLFQKKKSRFRRTRDESREKKRDHGKIGTPSG